MNFDLDYIDYSGSITGNVGDTVTIPVQAIFFQDEGYCDGQEEECSAFLVNSLDPSIDIDYTIRELQNVEFNDFGGGNLNNDFGNNGVGFEDLLTSLKFGPQIPVSQIVITLRFQVLKHFLLQTFVQRCC